MEDGAEETVPGDGAAVEAALVRRVANREAEALKELMARTLPRALQIARNVVAVEADAEDVVQEAFIRVWHNAARFEPARGRFTTWLFRIVVNLAIDRRRGRREQLPIESALAIADASPLADAAVQKASEQARLRAAVAALGDRQRVAIGLFYFDNMSSRQAAEVMGINDEAFQALLARARRALKAKLGGIEV